MHNVQTVQRFQRRAEIQGIACGLLDGQALRVALQQVGQAAPRHVFQHQQGYLAAVVQGGLLGGDAAHHVGRLSLGQAGAHLDLPLEAELLFPQDLG
jgi:hypothetical protein